jgi:hypothetical protein
VYEEKIKQMKSASADENWDLFRQSLQSLLCLMSHEFLMSLFAVYVKQFIDEYLQIHPEYATEYNAFATLEGGQISKMTLDNISIKFESHKGEPGVNEFRKANLKLRDLFSLEYCTAIYTDTLISSITNLFLAIANQSWGIENLDLWHRWFRGTTKEDSLILAKYYNTDPKRIEKSKSLRDQLIVSISEYLNVPM